VKIGVESGLLEYKHFEAMGSAVWLFMWLVHRQTRKSGLVLGGMPLNYQEIASRMGPGYKPRLVRLWLDRLRQTGYVSISHLSYKMLRVTVMKPKKWGAEQRRFDFATPRDSDVIASDHLTLERQSMRRNRVNHATLERRSKQTSSLKPIEAGVACSSSRPQDHTSCASKAAATPPACLCKTEKSVQNLPDALAVVTSPEVVPYSTPAPSTTATTQLAWSLIGFHFAEGPLGFRATWESCFAIGQASDIPLSSRMERAIELCKKRGLGVPHKFYLAKREVEGREYAERSITHELTRPEIRREQSQRALENVTGRRSGLADRIREGISARSAP